MNTSVCASSHSEVDWHSIDWAKCHHNVKRLQARMLKAQQMNKTSKVKALQWLLTHSFSAKALAVKRVTENKGKYTPGVDGDVWLTSETKAKAIIKLKRHGYKPSPLRRVYIAKTNGRRPLSIPTMIDRAMQVLYLQALEPIAELKADLHSYGFRHERSPADAMEQCFNILAGKNRAEYILEGDIRACFDELSHSWMQAHILLDKVMLRKWLKVGVIDNGVFYSREAGVAQGSPISPVLANLTLDGLGELLRQSFKAQRNSEGRLIQAKVHLVRFCDDFIITAPSKEQLEQEVKPLVESFLAARGLELSQSKTKISHIKDGFDFLGQTIRKYGDKVLTKPSKKSIKRFVNQARQIIKSHRTVTQAELIFKLNPLLRGWANYHRHIVAKRTFVILDRILWQMLWQWAKRRHPSKARSWIKAKYFKTEGKRNWVFACDSTDLSTKEQAKRVRLFNLSDTPIQRHIKIKADANPFDPAWESYFEKRLAWKMKSALWGRKKLLSLWTNQQGRCPYCDLPITQDTAWHIHHLLAKAKGGDDRQSNLILLHPNCHQRVHSLNLNLLKPAPQKGL